MIVEEIIKSFGSTFRIMSNDPYELLEVEQWLLENNIKSSKNHSFIDRVIHNYSPNIVKHTINDEAGIMAFKLRWL